MNVVRVMCGLGDFIAAKSKKPVFRLEPARWASGIHARRHFTLK
jgi:hypothetical protein